MNKPIAVLPATESDRKPFVQHAKYSMQLLRGTITVIRKKLTLELSLDAILHLSPLKEKWINNSGSVIYHELTGGLYFDEK